MLEVSHFLLAINKFAWKVNQEVFKMNLFVQNRSISIIIFKILS